MRQIEAWTPCRRGNQGLSVDMLTQLEQNTHLHLICRCRCRLPHAMVLQMKSHMVNSCYCSLELQTLAAFQNRVSYCFTSSDASQQRH